MGPEIKVEFDGAKLAELVLQMADPVAKATSLAIQEAGLQGKELGRAHIASKTKGNKLKGSWDCRFFPGGGKSGPARPSINAAVFFYTKAPPVLSMELGPTIRPHNKGLLWIPLRTAPRKVSRGNAAPKRLIDQGVSVFTIKSKTHLPILAARINRKRQVRGAVSLGQLRKAQGKNKFSVPLFFGIKSIKMPKLLNLKGIVDAQREKLRAYYDAALKVR